MLIRIAFGADTGAVVDMPPHEARAMLADGRAVSPEAAPAVVPTVEARTDRNIPKGHERRRR